MSMHTDRVIKTNGGGAVGQGVAKNFQSNNAVNIRRVSGPSDGAGSRFFDNLPGNTNLGNVKSQIASSTYNPIARPFAQKGFATSGGATVSGYGVVNAGFNLTQTRRNPGDSSLASAKPLAGIAGLAKFGGSTTYSLVKTYVLNELSDKSVTRAKWVDLYGRILEVNSGNIRLLNSKDSNAEITKTTFTDDLAPGTKSYSNNKGLVYYTKISASANPKIMSVFEASSSTANIN